MPAEIKENTISKIGEVFSFMRNSYENSVSNDILIDDI